MKSYGVIIQIKATEQYFPVVLFIMLYKVFLTFESVDEILWCDHSNESYWAVLSCGTVYYAVQGGSNFWVCGWNPVVWPFKWKLLSSTFLWYCLLCRTSWFQPVSPWINSCFFLASSFWEGDGLLLDTCAHSDTIMGVFSIFSKRKLADFSLILEPHGKCRWVHDSVTEMLWQPTIF